VAGLFFRKTIQPREASDGRIRNEEECEREKSSHREASHDSDLWLYGQVKYCRNFETYFRDATLGPNGVMCVRSYLGVSWQWPCLALTVQQSALDLTEHEHSRRAFNGAAGAYRGSSALAPLVKTAWEERPFRL
jgi:hypothetical protein